MADTATTATGEIMVTGSRVRGSPELQAKAVRQANPYADFLYRLQSAVHADDRDTVMGLIAFPLRVNAQGASRLYHDADSLERDYDKVFTRKVRRAILGQRAGQLFVRDQGAMIGNGEIWFDRTCPNAACSPAGPVRVTAVNP
jgi:hypothetical protein